MDGWQSSLERWGSVVCSALSARAIRALPSCWRNCTVQYGKYKYVQLLYVVRDLGIIVRAWKSLRVSNAGPAEGVCWWDLRVWTLDFGLWMWGGAGCFCFM